jgi:CDP-diacylglycerol pyrophosphatase
MGRSGARGPRPLGAAAASFVAGGARCRPCTWLGLLAASMALQACATSGTFSPPVHSTALWQVVNAGCNQGWAPVPSLHCDPARGDAVLKDICGDTHFLLIPTARRVGIESAELMRDEEPDYFGDAWAARERVIEAAERPVRPEELGLAVNSRWGRSQDQLHIHIDLVRPEVRDAIGRWLREQASSPDIELYGHTYRIVHAASLQRPSPFQRAGAGATAQQREMNTIAVVSDGASGFYVLIGHVDPGRLDRGHAEEILVPRQCGNRRE